MARAWCERGRVMRVLILYGKIWIVFMRMLCCSGSNGRLPSLRKQFYNLAR